MIVPSDADREMKVLKDKVSALEQRVLDLEQLIRASPANSSPGQRDQIKVDDNVVSDVEPLQEKNSSTPVFENSVPAEQVAADSFEQNIAQIAEQVPFQQSSDEGHSSVHQDEASPVEEKSSEERKGSNANFDHSSQSRQRGDEGRSPSPGSIESRIGLYWLSRLGIGFLVVGFALLISYAFQFCGPAIKIAMGFVVSSGLVWLSGFLESKRQTLTAFARVLAGGGWALAFFTAFAMHNIDSVRVIEDPLVAFALMSAITGGAVFHAVSKRSELIAILAVLLGFITIFLTPPGFFTASASALLAVTTAVLASRMKWFGLNYTGLFAGYLCYATIAPHIGTDTHGAQEQFWLSSAYLLPYWLSNLWTTMSLRNDAPAERAVALTTGLLNSSAFLALWLPSVHSAFGGANAYLATGAVHLGCSWWAAKRGQNALSTLYTLAGMTLATMYLPMVLNHSCTTLAIAIETALLVGLGLRYQMRGFRWFAMPLGLAGMSYSFLELMKLSNNPETILFPVICQWCLVAAWTISVFLYRSKALENSSSNVEKEVALYVYLSFAGLLAACIPTSWFTAILTGNDTMLAISAIWALEAFAGTIIAMNLRKLYPAILSSFGLLLAAGTASIPFVQFQPLWSAAAVGTLYAAPLVCRTWKNYGPNWTNPLFYIQFCIASLATTAFLAAHVAGEFIATLMTVQAFLIFFWGLVSKEKGIRTMSVPFFAIAVMFLLHPLTSLRSVLPVVATLYSCSFLYSTASVDQSERTMRHIFGVVASVTLAYFCGTMLHSGWISCAWSLQAAVLLACGFRLRDKCLRISGLTLFGFLACKLLLVDLAAAEAIHRILAFIVGGVALLGASFAYSWFSRQLDSNGAGQTGATEDLTGNHPH